MTGPDAKHVHRQVWYQMLRSRLSRNYYQLDGDYYRRWRLFAKFVLVIFVLGAVAYTSRSSYSWLQIVGGAAIPFVVALLEVLAIDSRVRYSENLFERWTDLAHDYCNLWDQVDEMKNVSMDILEKYLRCDERYRWTRSLETRSTKHSRVVEAERRLYEEIGVPFIESTDYKKIDNEEDKNE